MLLRRHGSGGGGGGFDWLFSMVMNTAFNLSLSISLFRPVPIPLCCSHTEEGGQRGGLPCPCIWAVVRRDPPYETGLSAAAQPSVPCGFGMSWLNIHTVVLCPHFWCCSLLADKHISIGTL